MADATIATPVPTRGFFSNLRENLHRKNMYRRTVKELSALGDRELDDIGLSRYDIERVAREIAHLG